MPGKNRITPLQLRFIDAYLSDPKGSGTAAAIAAGYKATRAKQAAHDLLNKPQIAEEIARRRAKVEQDVDIGVKDIVRGLHKEATLEGVGSTQAGRVAAWMGIAKCLGVEKLVHTGDPNNPVVHEIRRIIVDAKSDGARG